ncbi:MAG: RluA family pseudouridine synthase [Candidatus Omnitrophota bacterium]|jgi:23S rRNA pseudouridine1911/1915/1917 synthase
MREYLFRAEEEDQNMRLDIFLLESFKKEDPGFSRTFIQKLISQGKVEVSGIGIAKGAVKPHLKIKKGNECKVLVEDKVIGELKAEDISLDVAYEDDDLAVINKPCGIVVHPAPGNYEHTLVNALLHRFKKLSDINPARPGIVHRLDKDASGLLVIAKNNSAHLSLAKQFAAHTIKRKYIALVKGRMELDENVIEIPIGRHPYKRKNMAAGFGKNARYAKTYYRTLKRTDDFSVIELELFTGRTHQIRVHLSFLGHPVLGDAKYGKNNEFSRLALHAKYIGFLHPRTGDFVEFSSKVPPELAQ